MKKITILCGLIWVLILLATAVGVFYQTPGAPIAYTTVRGEQAVAQGSGLYRYDPAVAAVVSARRILAQSSWQRMVRFINFH